MAPDSPTAQVKVIAGWAVDLACPACHQPLRFEETHIVCTGCERAYPIVDGIPVLIPERAAGPESAGLDSPGKDAL